MGVTVLAFAITLFLDEPHYTIWGSAIAVLYGLASYFLVPDLLLSLSSFNKLDPLWEGAGLIGLILGLTGGIWGFFWKDSKRAPICDPCTLRYV